ncbi:hypothetical protein Q9233_007620 [Columba guinea]|nr:hypothetical protein Q9233_007620 [Columba guinea]
MRTAESQQTHWSDRRQLQAEICMSHPKERGQRKGESTDFYELLYIQMGYAGNMRQWPDTMLQAQNRPLYPSFSLSYGLGFQFVIVKELERSDPGSSAWNTLGPFGNIHSIPYRSEVQIKQESQDEDLKITTDLVPLSINAAAAQSSSQPGRLHDKETELDKPPQDVVQRIIPLLIQKVISMVAVMDKDSLSILYHTQLMLSQIVWSVANSQECSANYVDKWLIGSKKP